MLLLKTSNDGPLKGAVSIYQRGLVSSTGPSRIPIFKPNQTESNRPRGIMIWMQTQSISPASRRRYVSLCSPHSPIFIPCLSSTASTAISSPCLWVEASFVRNQLTLRAASEVLSAPCAPCPRRHIHGHTLCLEVLVHELCLKLAVLLSTTLMLQQPTGVSLHRRMLKKHFWRVFSAMGRCCGQVSPLRPHSW